jgi:hypothetical protein
MVFFRSGRFFRLKAEATPPYRRLRVLVRAIRGDALLSIRGDLRDPRRPLVTGRACGAARRPRQREDAKPNGFSSGASSYRELRATASAARVLRLKAEATPP